MIATKEFYSDVESLTEENFEAVKQFVLFLKYRNLIMQDDTDYLSSIPGMMESINEGVNTPLSECVSLDTVWADV